MTQLDLTIGGTSKRSKIAPFTRSVDFDALPEASRAFVIRYGLKQFLADGMAGETEQANAESGVDARIAKLLSGDLSRSRGEREIVDTVESRALKMARAAIRDKLKAANVTAEKEKVAEAAKALVASQPKWKAEAKKQLDAEAAAKGALADAETDALLADLLS